MPHGCYLFDDDTFGHIADPKFDVEEFIDNPDYDLLGSDDADVRERYIRSCFDGKLPIGNIYIDRWNANGEFYQGGCFLYYEGETLRDYCDRNGGGVSGEGDPGGSDRCVRGGGFGRIEEVEEEGAGTEIGPTQVNLPHIKLFISSEFRNRSVPTLHQCILVYRLILNHIR